MLRAPCVLALVVAFAAATPAGAATIHQGIGTTIVYDGVAGTDVVSVALAPSGLTFSSNSLRHTGGLSATSPCSVVSITTVTCPLPSALVVNGGAGDDEFSVSSSGRLIAVSMDGGPGADQLLGGPEPDTLRGGSGDDVLALAGGADDLHGDDGTDTVRTSGFAEGARVRVTLDDVSDDGRTGDVANVHSDVEDVAGGAADETVIGTPGRNVIATADGSDVIGAGGGFDDIAAGPGADHVDARDGTPDRIDCGGEFDSVVTDSIDVLTECEQLDVSSALEADSDHDGYPRQLDCNDQSAAIAPGGLDAPGDGVDEDCDGHDAAILDADGDGSPVPFDCDDRDPAVHPLAREIYGNTRDENCSGRADPFRALAPELKIAFRSDPRRSTFTRVTAFRVGGVPTGTTVRLTCRGGGCPLRVKAVTGSGPSTNLLSALRKARLAPGARLGLLLRRDDALTAAYIYTLRAGVAHTVHTCTRPDTGRVVGCGAR